MQIRRVIGWVLNFLETSGNFSAKKIASLEQYLAENPD